MRLGDWNLAALGSRVAFGLTLLASFAGGSSPVTAQSWPGHSHDAQHTGISGSAANVPSAIRWSTPVDTDPTYSGDVLYIHYGSPMITRSNTVVVPVKTSTTGNFLVAAFQSSKLTGKVTYKNNALWYLSSDYTIPPGTSWFPPWGPTLKPADKAVVFPAAGGTVMVRTFPDDATGTATREAFFGINNYNSNPSAFNSAIQICTPLTCDSAGNLYFGYFSSGAALPGYPNGIPSGLAKIAANGTGNFVTAAALSGKSTYNRIAFNCAPAVSTDGTLVYAAVTNGYDATGYLCSATTSNMQANPSIQLIDPETGGAASVYGDGTSTPTVGPDGDVYYGVLEQNVGHHNARGWMLHFNSTLSTTKTPGSFGWDDTPSIVPASLVPQYTGTSSYLILTKYNNYIGVGTGNGENKVAILDPNDLTEPDPVDGTTTVMKEIITVLGPTTNSNGGVYEWCINSAAVDPFNKQAVLNSEDGHMYIWNFPSSTLSTGLLLATPTPEAYTCTLIGPDGAVYAINNTVLNCCVPATAPTLRP
jgi:hypothetical protein